MGASNAGGNPPLPNQVKDTLPPESTILTQTTTSQETPIVVENPSPRNRVLAISFLIFGILFFYQAFLHLDNLFVIFGFGCLAASLFFEKSYLQQSKIDKTKLGESTKPERTFRYIAAVLVIIGIYLGAFFEGFSGNFTGCFYGIILFGSGLIFESIYLQQSKEYKTKLGESTKTETDTQISIITLLFIILLLPFLAYFLFFVIFYR
ncbi:MAG: hypothetical protein QGH13_06830 [Candidatus Thalassarchaeaceae archaeon]|nr:hypothetical protein [Candidatus Thalassarchaeaceae archaeon]